jgi:hypothetical protein
MRLVKLAAALLVHRKSRARTDYRDAIYNLVPPSK